MSTITKEFTKEQLIEKLQHRIAVAAKYPDLEEAQLDAAIFKIALASLEAEPVALRDERSGSGGISKKPGFNDLPHGAPLYTAHPAPVSVKDHQIRELVNELRDIAVEYHGTQQLRERIARTVRAAMLQSFGNSEQLNSPVVPDTWVACSERMPEREVDVQVYCPEKKEQMVAYLERNEGKGLFRFATWRTGDGIYCQPTHWMPLPAAPQQEAKNV